MDLQTMRDILLSTGEEEAKLKAMDEMEAAIKQAVTRKTEEGESPNLLLQEFVNLLNRMVFLGYPFGNDKKVKETLRSKCRKLQKKIAKYQRLFFE